MPRPSTDFFTNPDFVRGSAVLIAHPEPGSDGARALDGVIEEAGFPTRLVGDGRACSVEVTAGRCRILLLSMGIRDVDPIELLHSVRGVDADIEVVLLSDDAHLDEARAAYRGGLAELVHFPGTDLMDLVPVVTRALERRGARERIRRLLSQAQAATAAAVNPEVAEQLEALHRAKYEFLTLVSHELRTPITSLSSSIEMYEMFEGEERDRVITIMRREVARMEHLVREVDLHLQLTTGVVTPRPERVDLATLARQVENAARDQAGKRELVLRSELVELPPLETDPAMVTDCLERLLDNALKFSHSGGTVTVRLLPDGDGARLEVQDEGIGIAPQGRARVFAPLEVSDVEHHTYGYGLGLAIVRGQMRLLGGQVDFESAGEDAGATFRLTLPARPGSKTGYTSAPS